MLDWRPVSRCSKQLSSALHHSVDSLLRSSSSTVNNNWGAGLSLESVGSAVLGGSRSDMAKFARSQHSVDKATFALLEISCVYYRWSLLLSTAPGGVLVVTHYQVILLYCEGSGCQWMHFDGRIVFICSGKIT